MRKPIPLWAVAAVFILLVGLGVYGYFTQPLPFGLSGVVNNPGGQAARPVQVPAQQAPGARVSATQPLGLGAVTVGVLGVQRGQNLTTRERGPAAAYTVALVVIQNGGLEPLVIQPAAFSLIDERGRRYAVDLEASRAAAVAAQKRAPFESTVPPGGRLETTLAFETAPDAGALTLRVSLGYGEVELPRQ